LIIVPFAFDPPYPIVGEQSAKCSRRSFSTFARCSWRALSSSLSGAFPDLHLDIEQILAVDPYVIVRWRSTGTHLGRLGDIQPTARKVSLHGCSVMEVKAMKGSHSWVYFDNAHLLRQIGVLPSH
jgi:predicted ester cyclase